MMGMRMTTKRTKRTKRKQDHSDAAAGSKPGRGSAWPEEERVSRCSKGCSCVGSSGHVYVCSTTKPVHDCRPGSVPSAGRSSVGTGTAAAAAVAVAVAVAAVIETTPTWCGPIVDVLLLSVTFPRSPTSSTTWCPCEHALGSCLRNVWSALVRLRKARRVGHPLIRLPSRTGWWLSFLSGIAFARRCSSDRPLTPDCTPC
mmetsp:Transcript_12228/g.37016  ORF Transcript_12228/g.37016 Transcript_12228/m.37016 type:complete len:200 (-) Transcript_12228:379-978(-)